MNGGRIPWPADLSQAECQLIEQVMARGLTMVSYERLIATLMACRHVVEQAIPGDFVECGVWRGGKVTQLGMTLEY